MASKKFRSYFTNDELKTLQAAFDLACRDLNLCRADDADRERLAAFVFQAASSGLLNVTMLKKRAMVCFRLTSAMPDPEPLYAPVPPPLRPLRKHVRWHLIKPRYRG